MHLLLAEFMHSTSEHVEKFLEHERDFLTSNRGYSYNQSMMRGALIDWVNSNLEFHEVHKASHEFIVDEFYKDDVAFTQTYPWAEADILLEIMKKDKDMKNARKEEDDYYEPTFNEKRHG